MNYSPSAQFKGIDGRSVINVIIPTERGGNGDIASNLQMVELIKKKYPGIKINIFYPGSNAGKKLETLVPSFASDHSVQFVSDCLFVDTAQASKLPKADVVVSFSNYYGDSKYLLGYDFKLREVFDTAPLALNFTEFGDYHWEKIAQLDRGNWRGTPVDLRMDHSRPQYQPKIDFEPGHTPVVNLNTGAGNGGFYISPTKPAPDLSAADLESKLRSLSAETLFGSRRFPIDSNTHVGFAYASEDSVANYLKAAVQKAFYEPSNRFAIFVNSTRLPDTLEIKPLPPNLQIIRIDKLPYELTREVVARADLPVLVTGDGSLNLALEYEKPFIYDLLYGKQESARALRAALLSSEPLKGNAKAAETLKKVLPVTAPSSNMHAIVPKEGMFEAMMDKDFQKAFAASLHTNRPRHVLMDHIDSLFRHFAGNGVPSESDLYRFLDAQAQFQSSSSGCVTESTRRILRQSPQIRLTE